MKLETLFGLILVALLDIGGIACLCYGLWLCSPPAALIVGGALMLVAAYRISNNYLEDKRR